METKQNPETLQAQYNRMQMISMIVDANEEYVVAGRGTGKTSGPQAHRTQRNAHSMPRSLGGCVAATFQQLLVRTLPAVIQGWERLGFVRDKHFFIGHYAPKKLKWDKPYLAPIDPKYLIHWYTGAAQLMISQDGVGMANGLSLDYLHGDEVKFIDYDKLKQETLPTLRGNLSHFGHLSEHHSILMTTDRPTTSKGRWIYEKKVQTNQDQVKVIIEADHEIRSIISAMDSYSPTYQRQQLEKVKRMKRDLSIVRKNCVHYHEASALENLEILGVDYIIKMRRNMTDVEFRTAILNEDVIQIEGGFYAKLNDEIHTYDSFDYSHFENVGYDFEKLHTHDCRSDGDLIKSLPLDLAIDYNSSINIASIGQPIANEYRVIKSLYVLHPHVLKDLAEKFCDYYRLHPTREVNYYYDHTAIGSNASSIKSFKDEVCEVLIDRGWKVNAIYTGQAPDHEDKYRLIAHIMGEKNPDLPYIRINKSNCSVLLLSMKLAPVKQGKDGWKKDKTSEHRKGVPATEATHGSDSFDQLIWGKFKERFKAVCSEFIPNVF